MSRRDAITGIIYYLVVIGIVWAAYRDGPPLRVMAWYYTYRTTQAIARTAGRIGLSAEHAYHTELQRNHA